MHCELKNLARAVLGAASAGVVVASAPSFAQAPERLERIEVTGSNIKRTDTEGPAPVQIITRKEIEQSGYTTVQQLLENLPGNNSGGFNESNVNSFAAGAAAVSLRGLGPQSTLILLNGRRLTNYGFAVGAQSTFVDLNTIPLEVIERVEILKDGASAIYGSEAIAGVVNIILRADYRGGQVTGSYGLSGQNDGRELRGSATVGIGDLSVDRFNAFINVESFRRNPIFQRDRDYYVNSTDRRSVGYIDQRSTNSYPGNFYTGTGANGGGAFLSRIGNSCRPELISDGGPTGIAAGRCLLNANDYIVAVPKSKRDNVYGRVNFQITASTLAYLEAGQSQTKTQTVSSPTFLTTWLRATPTGGVVLDNVSNIILPATYRGNTTGQAVTPRYSFGDVGPRIGDVDSKLSRILLGGKGSFGAFDWDSAVGYIKSDTENVQRNYISASVFRNLVASNAYAFGNPGANDPAIYPSLSPTLHRSGETTTKFIDAKVSGEIFQLPAGPLGMAVGAEYRRETLDDRPDAFVSSGDVIGVGATSASGARNATAVYAELSVPVLKTLETQLAVRHDHYSDFGNSTTPKVGFKFTPIQQAALRGTYAEGFRAPSLPEISQSVVTGFFNNITDPARCFSVAAADCNINIPAQIGANPALKPEKSKSYTLGFVVEPVRDLSATVDYFWIHRKNEVQSLDIEVLLANEANFPGKVIRQPSTQPGVPGPIEYVNLQYQNLGSTTVRGLDFDIRYRSSLFGSGKLTTALNTTYIISYYVRPTADSDPINYNSSHNQPRLRGDLSFTYETGPWTGTLKYKYIGSFDYRGSPQIDCALQAAYPPGCSIGSYNTIDAGVGYTGFKNLRLFANVLNLMDKKAPLDLNNTQNYNFEYHNIVGRFFSVGATYKFF